MEALLDVVQLGRACRNAANMKVRQPAAALYVKGAQLRERLQRSVQGRAEREAGHLYRGRPGLHLL